MDAETKIPVTVTDQNGSEGLYAKFKLKSSQDRVIKINNLSVQGNEKLDLEKEKENIFVSIKEIKNSTNNFKEDNVVLGTATDISQAREFTLLFWFSSIASEEFESCTISFDLIFE